MLCYGTGVYEYTDPKKDSTGIMILDRIVYVFESQTEEYGRSATEQECTDTLTLGRTALVL